MLLIPNCCTSCMQAVPLLAMLDDLVPRMEEGQAGILRKVVFVWLSHTGDEFSIMDPSLLELARQALLHSQGPSLHVAVCSMCRASQALPCCWLPFCERCSWCFQEKHVACFYKAVPARCLPGTLALTRELSTAARQQLPSCQCFCTCSAQQCLLAVAAPRCLCSLPLMAPAGAQLRCRTSFWLCCAPLLCLQAAGLAGHPPPHHTETCVLPELAQPQQQRPVHPRQDGWLRPQAAGCPASRQEHRSGCRGGGAPGHAAPGRVCLGLATKVSTLHGSAGARCFIVDCPAKHSPSLACSVQISSAQVLWWPGGGRRAHPDVCGSPLCHRAYRRLLCQYAWSQLCTRRPVAKQLIAQGLPLPTHCCTGSNSLLCIELCPAAPVNAASTMCSLLSL